jgi:hypothetical protein
LATFLLPGASYIRVTFSLYISRVTFQLLAKLRVLDTRNVTRARTLPIAERQQFLEAPKGKMQKKKRQRGYKRKYKTSKKIKLQVKLTDRVPGAVVVGPS